LKWFKSKGQIDFVGKKSIALSISALMILLSFGVFFLKGIKYGIDFAGGTLIEVKFDKTVPLDKVREALEEGGMSDAILQPFGEQNEILIKTKATPEAIEAIKTTVSESLTQKVSSEFEIRRVELVGPKVGKDLRSKGIKALIFCIIGILLYITWRFEFRFALGAVIALIHDVLISLGIYTLAGKEVNLPTVAALLTILGYSLNDTIVVYDRIRENMKKMSTALEVIINRSINEVMKRSVLTSFTTIIPMIVIWSLGLGILKDFSFIIIFGIIVGTYSSIYIASPVVLFFEKKAKR